MYCKNEQNYFFNEKMYLSSFLFTYLNKTKDWILVQDVALII